MKNDKGDELALAVEQALNVLGGPVMSYYPDYANRERQIYIQVASDHLVKALKRFRKPSQRK